MTIKLNIGGGYKKISGYVNVDNDANCNPDYLVNIETEKLPFEDSSVSRVIAHHILEHLGEGYFHFLKELYRVCEHGALIDIRVPHHNHETFHSDPTHRRPITVEGLRLFSKKVNHKEIESNGRSSTLGIMFDVDFEIVSYEFIYDSFYDEILKTTPPEYLMRLLREANNTTIEVHIILTVIKE